MAARTFPRIAEVRAYIQESNLPGGSSHPPRNAVEAHQSTAEVHGLGRCESAQLFIGALACDTLQTTISTSLSFCYLLNVY